MAEEVSGYRLNRFAFKATTAKDADNHIEYWRNKTTKERLNAAFFLINQAYGTSSSTRIDKKVFLQRKQS